MYNNSTNTENNFEKEPSFEHGEANELREKIAQEFADAMADAPPFNPNGYQHDADVMEATFDTPPDTESPMVEAVAEEAADKVLEEVAKEAAAEAAKEVIASPATPLGQVAMAEGVVEAIAQPSTPFNPEESFMQRQARAIEQARGNTATTQAPERETLLDLITGNTDKSKADSQSTSSSSSLFTAIGHQNAVETIEGSATQAEASAEESSRLVDSLIDEAISAGVDVMESTNRQESEKANVTERLDDMSMDYQEDGHLEQKIKLDDDECEGGFISAAAFEEWKTEAIEYFTKFPYCEHFMLVDPNTNEVVVDFTPENVKDITYQSARKGEEGQIQTEATPIDQALNPGIYEKRNEGLRDLNEDYRDEGRIKKLNVQAPDNIVLAELERARAVTAETGATNVEDAYTSLRNRGFSNEEIATAANAASTAVSGFEQSGGSVGEGIAGTSDRQEDAQVIENAALSAAAKSIEAAAETAMGNTEQGEQLASSAAEAANGARQGAESMQSGINANGNLGDIMNTSNSEARKIEQLASGTEQYASNVAEAASKIAANENSDVEAANEQEEDNEEEETLRIGQNNNINEIKAA